MSSRNLLFMLVDYTGRIAETNEVFDTTIKEDAEKNNLLIRDEELQPKLIIPGSGWFPKGLEEALISMKKGEEKEIEVPPEKGYGPRDVSKIRTYPLRKFRNISDLKPGVQVEIDGRIGTVRLIRSGRVQVDFNPPLAGRTLIYHVKVKDIIRNRLLRVKHLIKRRIPSLKIEDIKVNIKESTVTIELPSESYTTQGIQIIKNAIYNDITKYIPSITEVVFVERYGAPKKKVKTTPSKRKKSKKASIST
ncbi:MAG TPA: peptidylprolyl isomerase [Candidatus Bathyarchaeota archaeon]|nr:peptidylprolyl isomerase [Candidatus Bathyarchaeota archaeon]